VKKLPRRRPLDRSESLSRCVDTVRRIFGTAPKMSREKKIIINLSGRRDKDVDAAAKYLL
jgi:tryptophan synthase beta subunit